jgi:hypothetical protein
MTSVKPVEPMKLAAVTAKRFLRQCSEVEEAIRTSL